jgi:epoxyqueuosine reductase
MKPEQIIKAEAKNLGFSLTGITTPDTPEHFGFFESWLSAGYQADMKYLMRQDTVAKRYQPKELMPECKSIICLAFPYPNANELVVNGGKPTGRIAAYAWLPDYHLTIPILINDLMIRIENYLGRKIEYKTFTDSAPILERDIAQRAGLGWIGKNSCLIHPVHGSYFLIAEIFTDIELEIDQPLLADRCGSCARCLKACPTHCILPDRTIDANRCISYLTIENKGPIPPDLRKFTGNWVFGCDICQMVCPWNRMRVGNLRHLNLAALESRLLLPDAIEEMSLSDQEFKRRFADTPILRLKRKGYLRNIAIALGNMRSREAVPTLLNSLTVENEPLIRGAAAWALGQIGGEMARSTLQERFVQEGDVNVREELRLALNQIENNII